MVADEPMYPWPRLNADLRNELPKVGVVAVTHNTRHLLARLLFGLRCVLDAGVVKAIVIVDNASTDGSGELLSALREVGLVDMIWNKQQRYHGPGLTQAVNSLALRQAQGEIDLNLVWALDTDISLLRPDTLSAAAAAMAAAGAVLAGEPDDGDDRPPHLTDQQVALNSFLFDPAVVWQPRHRPFLEDGDPSRHLQQDIAAEGHRTLAFPFRSHGYLVHHGRSTLAVVARAGDTTNRYHSWAVDHQEPHFGLHPHGAALAASFEATFQQAVRDETDATLVQVLLRAEQVTMSPIT